MRIDLWLQLKRTKIFCLALATLFACEQAVWGADVNVLQALRISGEQQRQLEQTLSAAVWTIYEDLYSRTPTADELREALEFLRRMPRLAHLVERLSQSPEYRWRLRQLNPERITRRKEEATQISEAVSRMVGVSLREIAQGTQSIVDSPQSTVQSPEPRTLNPEQHGREQQEGLGTDDQQGLSGGRVSVPDTDQFQTTRLVLGRAQEQPVRFPSHSASFSSPALSDHTTTAHTAANNVAHHTTTLRANGSPMTTSPVADAAIKSTSMTSVP